MKYMGSKARIAKYILPIILKDRKEGQWYVEPFVGGANMIDKVDGNRIGYDSNEYLIELLSAAACGYFGYDEIDKELYSKARGEYNSGKLSEFTKFQIGWIGFMGSANGRFFDGGYSGVSNTKIGTTRDYIQESIRNIKNQARLIRGVTFISKSYNEINLHKSCIIYCDPPYAATKQYSKSNKFNRDEFWEWCREMTKQGHQVFISEYDAPEDFECIWEMELKSSLSANGKSGGNKVSTEKLFKYILP